MIKGGNRAEVRRERKKRDILSPVNVPKISSTAHLQFPLYQIALPEAILFSKKTFDFGEKISVCRQVLNNCASNAYGTTVAIGKLEVKENIKQR